MGAEHGSTVEMKRGGRAEEEMVDLMVISIKEFVE